MGRLYRGAGDLASLPGGAASSGQFYKWVSGTTTCLYLYRVRPDNGQTLNGVHCYNTTTCDVCAFDFKGARPTLWRLLQTPAAPGFEDCSECHAAGPVTPKKPFWDGVKPETEAINLECATRWSTLDRRPPQLDPASRRAPRHGAGQVLCVPLGGVRQRRPLVL